MTGPRDTAPLLLIDDDELSRAVLELHLAEAGFHVVEADGAAAALAYLRAAPGRVSAILSDLQMPGLCGPALAAELRRLVSPGTPLLAMSGSEPAPAGWRGYDAFLLKPFSPEQMLAVLEALRQDDRSPTAAETQTRRNAAQSGVLDSLAAAAADSPQPETEAETEIEAEAIPEILHGETFDQLASMLQPAQMAELFALSFSELDRHVALLHQATAAADAAAFRHSAHTIKGAAAVVGARELQALAARLETGIGSPADQAATLREIPLAAQRLRGMLSTRGVPLLPAASTGEAPS